MNGDYRNSVIVAVLGFVIMICASFGVMKILPLVAACSIVMVIGVILVIVAIVNIYYPHLLRGKEELPEPSDEDESSLVGDDEEPKE